MLMLIKNQDADKMVINNDLLQMIVIVVVIIIGTLSYLLLKKKSQKIPQSDIIEGANLLMTVLPRAFDEKRLENPLLSSSKQSPQIIDSLHTVAIYLIFCLTAINRSKGKANYIDSQDFVCLWYDLVPHLTQLYIRRGISPERTKELMEKNLQKIKRLLVNYAKEIKLTQVDASLAVQAWFDELIHINLANKPYLTEILLKIFNKDNEQAFIKKLCQPKTYSLLVDKIRDDTESFLRFNQPIESEVIQQSKEILSSTYIEHYIASFLLNFGITTLNQAKGYESYLHSSEYQAIKNKAKSMIKGMLLNSRKMGVGSINLNQTKQIMAFMEQQLTSLETSCQNYLKTTNNPHAEANPVNYLMEWFKQTLPSHANTSKLVESYIKTALKE